MGAKYFGLWLVAVFSTLSIAAGGNDTRVADAAKKSDTAAVRTLLQQKANVNVPQADGATALHWAAHWDDVDMADALIRAGAVVNTTNDFGVTPVWLACLNGSAPMVERLLKAGANPNAALPSGETSLMTASRSGNAEAVKLLVARGANVNAVESVKGQTALMWAVAERHPKVVQALLEVGANASARSEPRPRRVNTTSGGATWEPRTTMDVEQGGYTPLLFAAREGDLESARLLVAAGAKVNENAPDGTSPLVVATHSGHSALAVFLLDKGADANAVGAGYTAMHAAILRKKPDVVKGLLAHGASPNAPLVKATAMRRASADWALEFDMIGATPFWLAAQYSEPEAMRLLAAAGADPMFAMDGATALMAAISARRRAEPGVTPDPIDDERITLEAIRVGIDAGVDVNAANKDGNTAVHLAVQRRLNTVVQFLADKGATLTVKNKRGQTPLAMAGSGGGGRGGFGGAGGGATAAATAELLRKLGAKE